MSEGIVEIEYFGGAAFKVTTANGLRILIDPFLKNNPLCSRKLDYFYDADIILVTHGTYDHMGDSIEIMNNSKAILICGDDVARYAESLNVPRERVRKTVYGDEKVLSGIRVKAVYARHLSRVISDDTGEILFHGIPMGYIITTEDGIRILHTGDSSIHGDLNQFGMLYRPNIMMLGVGSVRDGASIDMDIREAAFASLMVGPDIVLPMHYAPGSDKPAEFIRVVKIIAPNVEAIWLQPGNKITYSKYRVQ